MHLAAGELSFPFGAIKEGGTLALPLEYSVHVLEPSVPSACINWKRWLLGKDTERSQEREVAVKAGVALPSQQSTPVNVVKTGMGLIFEPGGKLRVWNIRF